MMTDAEEAQRPERNVAVLLVGALPPYPKDPAIRRLNRSGFDVLHTASDYDTGM
jgi:hypothetical protein